MDAPGEIPGRVDGDIRIVAVDLHTEMCGSVRHQGPDRTQTDDTQLLTADLTSGEFFFLLLRHFADVFQILIALHPLDAPNDITGGQQHTGEHQLLYAICVGAGCVEDHDPFFRAFIQGDVVDTCPGPCDRRNGLGDLHLQHIGAAHQNSLCTLQLVRFLIIFTEQLQTPLRNGV